MNHLLTEEELQEFLGIGTALGAVGRGAAGLMRGAGALMRGAKSSPQQLNKVNVPKAMSQKKAAKQAAKDYDSSIFNKLGFSHNSWVGKLRQQQMANAIRRKGSKAYHDAVINNMKYATEKQSKLANLGLTMFTGAVFLYGLRDYLNARWALDENAPDYQDQLNKLNGEFLFSFLVPKFLGAGLKLTSGIVHRLIRATGHPKAAEMARRWGGHVAKVGEAAALAFFQTDKGKKWLASTLGDIIDVAGAGLEWVIDFGTEAVQGIATMAKGAVDYFTGKGLPGGGFADPFDKTDRPKTITKSFN